MAIRLHTNIDEGSVQIAINEKYQGSLRLYEEGCVKFFAQLFRLSINVEIDGQKFTVNKKEYIRFLHKLKYFSATTKNVAQLCTFDPGLIIPQNNGYMRDHLPEGKVERLGRRLIDTLPEVDNYLLIEKLLEEGANPNLFFSILGAERKIIHALNPEQLLPNEEIPSFEELLITPLLYAAMHHNKDLIRLLLRFGADQHAEGQLCYFSRQIVKVSRKNITEETATSQSQSLVSRGVRVTPVAFPKIKELRTFCDTWWNINRVVFNADQGDVTLIPIPEKKTRMWSDFQETTAIDEIDW